MRAGLFSLYTPPANVGATHASPACRHPPPAPSDYLENSENSKSSKSSENSENSENSKPHHAIAGRMPDSFNNPTLSSDNDAVWGPL